MKICPKCGCDNWNDVPSCEKCDSSLTDVPVSVTPTTAFKPRLSSMNGKRKHRAISTLRFFALLNLIGGIIGSIVVYIMLGSVVKYSAYDKFTETNPYGIILAVAWFIEGVFGCVFLLVICDMAENLIAIRENTQKPEVS